MGCVLALLAVLAAVVVGCGGDADAWAAFDPKRIVEAHRFYYDMAAWIGVSDTIPTRHWPAGSGSAQSESLQDWDNYSTTSPRRQTVSRTRYRGLRA